MAVAHYSRKSPNRFALLESRCPQALVEFRPWARCPCGYIACPRVAEHQEEVASQVSFERYEATQRGFIESDLERTSRGLPALVSRWIAEHRRARDRPARVILGATGEVITGLESLDGLLADCLAEILDAELSATVVTRRRLPERILALLEAHRERAQVLVPLATLDHVFLAEWEPGAASATQRLFLLQQLTRREVPRGVVIDPIVPFINDEPRSLRLVAQAAAQAGAQRIGVGFPRWSSALAASIAARSTASVHLIEGAYLDRTPSGARRRVLPQRERREEIYRHVGRYARQFGLEPTLCACGDPDLGGGRCRFDA